MKKEIMDFGLFNILKITVCVFVLGGLLMSLFHNEEFSGEVLQKHENVSRGRGQRCDEYVVRLSNGKEIVVINDENLLRGKTSTKELEQKIKLGNTYKFKAFGFMSGILQIFELNVTSAELQ